MELFEEQHLCMKFSWKQQDFLWFQANAKMRTCSYAKKFIGFIYAPASDLRCLRTAMIA
jgi:hypothetical protein